MKFWLVGASLAAFISKARVTCFDGGYDDEYDHGFGENDFDHHHHSDDFGLGDAHLSRGLEFGHDVDHGLDHDPYDDHGLYGDYQDHYNEDFDSLRGSYGYDAYGYGAGSDGKYGHGGFAYKGYGPPGFKYRGGNPALKQALYGKPYYAAGAKLEMGHGGIASPLNVITNSALHGNFNPLRNFGYGGLGGLSNEAIREINYYRLKNGQYPLDPNDLDGDGEADHLTKTKHKIDEYIAKQWKLGKRKLTVSVNYGNMPLEYQYLGQYHGFPNPVAGTPLGQMFGLPVPKEQVLAKYGGGGPYDQKHGPAYGKHKGHMRRGPPLPDLKYEAKYEVKKPDFQPPEFHFKPMEQPEEEGPTPPSRPPPHTPSNERPQFDFVPPSEVDYVPPGAAAAVNEGGSPLPPPLPLPPPPSQPAADTESEQSEEETKKKPLWERLQEAWESDEEVSPPPQQMRPPQRFREQFNNQPPQNNNPQPVWAPSTQQQPSWMAHLVDDQQQQQPPQQQQGGGNNQFPAGMMNPAQLQEQSAQHLQSQHNTIYPQGVNLQGNFEGGMAEYEPMPQAPEQSQPGMGGGMVGGMGGGMVGGMGGGMGGGIGPGMGPGMGGVMGGMGGMGGDMEFGGMGGNFAGGPFRPGGQRMVGFDQGNQFQGGEFGQW